MNAAKYRLSEPPHTVQLPSRRAQSDIATVPALTSGALRFTATSLLNLKIRRGGTGDKPRSTTERQVLECPLDENRKPILEGDEIHSVDTGPHDLGEQA
jgi:hypothetical protein